MSQREGSTFSIECPYATQPGDKQPKAWCRVRNARCELVAWTLASMQYIYSDRARQGHITIQDDNRTMSITMSHLQAEDSGIYSCMYSSNYVPLKTISLNVYKGEYYFFPHKLTSCQRTTLLLPRSILLPSLDPLSPQPPTLAHRLPRSAHAVKEPHKAHCPGGTQLCPAQSPPPWLMAGPSPARARSRMPSCPPLTLTTNMLFAELHKWELDSLSVQCPYGALGYSWGRKAWCRQQGQAECSLVVSTGSSYTWGSSRVWNKSSSIQDDAQTETVTITMDRLQAQDSGVYWCALYNPSQRPAFTRIMEVRLSVDKSEYLLAGFDLTSLAQSPFSPVPTKKEPSAAHAQHLPRLSVCLSVWWT